MLTKESFKEQYKDAPILDAPLADGIDDEQPMPCYLVHGSDPNDAIAVVMNATDPSEALQVVVSKLGVDNTSRGMRASTYPTASRKAVRQWLGKPEPVKADEPAPLDGEFAPSAATEGDLNLKPVPVSEPAPAGVAVHEHEKKGGNPEPVVDAPGGPAPLSKVDPSGIPASTDPTDKPGLSPVENDDPTSVTNDTAKDQSDKPADKADEPKAEDKPATTPHTPKKKHGH